MIRELSAATVVAATLLITAAGLSGCLATPAGVRLTEESRARAGIYRCTAFRGGGRTAEASLARRCAPANGSRLPVSSVIPGPQRAD